MINKRLEKDIEEFREALMQLEPITAYDVLRIEKILIETKKEILR